MARFRRAAALIACAVMASTVTGCANTTYSVKYGDNEVKAGVYIGYLQNELNNQIYMLSAYQGITEDYFSQEVDGVNLSEYVKNNSLKDIKEYVAIKKQFEELGLEISDDDLKEMNTNLNNSWDSMGGMYEYDGVSKESLKEIYKESLMRNMIFDHYYGEGGAEAPSDDDLQKYVQDNFIRYKMISIYKSTDSDESKKEEENKTKLETRDTFYEKGKDLTFEEFDSLIHEYEDSSSKAAEESANADNDSSSDESTDTSSVDDTSSAASDDTSSVADASSEESAGDASSDESSESSAAESSETASDESTDASSETTAAEGSEASVNGAEETSDASSEETPADSSEVTDDASSEENADAEAEAEEEPEEEDPYEHEAMIDLGNYKDEDYETESGKLFKFIKDAEVGKVLTFENDNAYYIVVKGDVKQRTDYAPDNRSTLVESMKKDEFQSKIDSWIEAADIQVNEKAIKRYTPEVIYDRMVDYSKKNSNS